MINNIYIIPIEIRILLMTILATIFLVIIGVCIEIICIELYIAIRKEDTHLEDIDHNTNKNT